MAGQLPTLGYGEAPAATPEEMAPTEELREEYLRLGQDAWRHLNEERELPIHRLVRLLNLEPIMGMGNDGFGH